MEGNMFSKKGPDLVEHDRIGGRRELGAYAVEEGDKGFLR
jgi:hypothetical protein